MNQNNSTDNYADEIDLRDLFKIIWDKKLFIGTLTSIAAIISVIYALNMPNVYSSSSLFFSTIAAPLVRCSILAYMSGNSSAQFFMQPTPRSQMSFRPFFEIKNPVLASRTKTIGTPTISYFCLRLAWNGLL